MSEQTPHVSEDAMEPAHWVDRRGDCLFR